MATMTASHVLPIATLQCATYGKENWRGAYQAAIFETDRSLSARKIRAAEILILQREQYLFCEGMAVEERQSLNQALHSLRALRMCLEL